MTLFHFITTTYLISALISTIYHHASSSNMQPSTLFSLFPQSPLRLHCHANRADSFATKSSSFPACWAVSPLLAAPKNTTITLLYFGSQDSSTLAHTILFFGTCEAICFWQLFLPRRPPTYCIRERRPAFRSCQFVCDKLQTASVSRGQMFTGVSNLITAENREKTSKCNWTGCKATGHPHCFYGTGQRGSSEAK